MTRPDPDVAAAPSPSRWRVAAAAAVAYLVAASVVGEVWPLTRFPMYAASRREGVLPLVLVDGAPEPLERFVDIHGCTPQQIRPPPGVPCRMGWRLDELSRWLEGHTGAAPGPVTLRFGYADVVAGGEGPRVSDDFHELCVATARRSP